MTDLELAIYYINTASGCITRAQLAGLEVDGHLARSLKTLEDLRSTLKCVDACWKPVVEEKNEVG